MSDQAQGPGWWQASDDRWYPPERHPDYRPPPPDARPAPPSMPRAPARILTVKGVNGTVAFDGRVVSISRSGLGAVTIGKGEKRIPVSSIAAVQWKPCTVTTRGYIQFTIPGGNERRAQFGKGTIDAAKDENSVLFKRSQEADFQQLRSAIEAQIG